MWHQGRIKEFVVMMSVVFFLLAGSYVQAAEKVEMHIMGLYDLSGPYSSHHQLIVRGAKDCEAFVNETERIPGVKLVHDIYDTGTDVSKSVSAWQTTVGKKPKPVFSTAGVASTIGLAIKPLAERNRVVCLAGISARPVNIPPGWLFSTIGQYEGMLGAMADWLKANWKSDSKVDWIQKHYQNRPPRISVLGWDNAFGRSFDQPEARAYLKKIGVEFIQPEYISMSPANTTPELLRLKKAGVDLVYIAMNPTPHNVVLKDAERLGIRDDFMMSPYWGYMINHAIKLVGPLADNLIMMTGFNPLIEEWPKYFQDAFQKSGLGSEYSEGYCIAISWWDIYCETIQRAIKAVGSAEKVDGDAIYQAITSIKDFRPMAFTSTLSFSKTKTIGPDTGDIFQVQKGKVVRIAKDWPIPDLHPGGKDVPK